MSSTNNSEIVFSNIRSGDAWNGRMSWLSHWVKRHGLPLRLATTKEYRHRGQVTGFPFQTSAGRLHLVMEDEKESPFRGNPNPRPSHRLLATGAGPELGAATSAAAISGAVVRPS